jgi:hypothetical protein
MGFLDTYAPAGAQGLAAMTTSFVSATADGQLVIEVSARCLSTGIYRWEIADAILRIRLVSDGPAQPPIVFDGD